MAVLTLYKDFKDSSAVIGYVIRSGDGYIFNPRMAHHKPSRKVWPTPGAAIPTWAKKMADRVEAAA